MKSSFRRGAPRAGSGLLPLVDLQGPHGGDGLAELFVDALEGALEARTFVG